MVESARTFVPLARPFGSRKGASVRLAKQAPTYMDSSASDSKSSSKAPAAPRVAMVMGSKSDWETMKHADEMLTQFNIPHVCEIVSAHRTPLKLADLAANAEARGIAVIIAGAGGAAHLPGMIAAQTVVPVLGVPVQSHALSGMDSLLSIVQMPAGVPVGTLAIGKAGAINAALLAAAILSISDPALREKLHAYRQKQTQSVMNDTLDTSGNPSGS
jgi:5-(carboxyamino)imidazole ribonucleotide mutase